MSKRLDDIEARLTHLELWMSRSLNEHTVYPIFSDMKTLAEDVMTEVREMRAAAKETN